MHRFRATIQKGSFAANSWSFVQLPAPVARDLAGARRVTGTIENTPFDGSLQSRGGGVKTLLVKRELRDALGLQVGQEVDVALEADGRQQTLDIPAELTAALRAHPDVARAFEALSPSHRREYAGWIAQARKPETKSARVERALA